MIMMERKNSYNSDDSQSHQPQHKPHPLTGPKLAVVPTEIGFIASRSKAEINR